jgi:hypothetical protein
MSFFLSVALKRAVQCEGAAVVCVSAVAVAWSWVGHEACQVQLVQHSVLLCIHKVHALFASQIMRLVG